MAELDEAIASATDTILKDAEKAGVTAVPKESETEEQETEADESDEPESDDEPEVQELNADQLKEAQTLYRALLDPNLQGPTIAALAQRMGILNNPKEPIETKEDVKEARKDILTILTEALPEYPHIAKQLGPAIQQILEQERSEHQQEMQQVHLNQVENDVNKSLETLRRETKGNSKAFENKMAQLTEKIVASPGTTTDEYVRMLYAIASAGSTGKQATAQIADKIRRNATNAHDRVKGSPGSERITSVPDKKMNLNQSVNWAIEQASKGIKVLR